MSNTASHNVPCFVPGCYHSELDAQAAAETAAGPEQQQHQQQAAAPPATAAADREWLIADKQQAMLEELLQMGVKREELVEILAEMGQTAADEETLVCSSNTVDDQA